MIILKQLEQLGLSEKEAKVYLALLEVGEATPQELSARSGINRATTYVILENLKKQDLVRSFNRQKKLFFALENPLQILEMLYQNKKKLSDKIEVAKRIMPELEMLARLTSERAKVKFYEGKEGIVMIQQEVFRSKPKEVYNIWNINIMAKEFPPHDGDHRRRNDPFIKKRKSIAVYDAKKEIPKMPLFKNEERKYLPDSKFPFKSELVIYNHKVILVAANDKFLAVVIDNKDIAEGLKSLFELAWQGAEKYKPIKK